MSDGRVKRVRYDAEAKITYNIQKRQIVRVLSQKTPCQDSHQVPENIPLNSRSAECLYVLQYSIAMFYFLVSILSYCNWNMLP